jgi:hypothetical protein
VPVRVSVDVAWGAVWGFKQGFKQGGLVCQGQCWQQEGYANQKKNLLHGVFQFLSLRDCLTYRTFIRGHMRAVWTNAKIQSLTTS